MAQDGCQPPAWAGQAFPFLPKLVAEPHASYATAPAGLGAASAAGAAAAAAPSPPPSRARTGTWDGPAPRGRGAAPPPTPPPGAPPPAPVTDVRLTTSGPSVRLPLLGLAVTADTPPSALEAGLAAGVRRWEVDAGGGAPAAAAAAALGAALASAPADAKAGLALTARLPPLASGDAALAAVEAVLAAVGVDKLTLLLVEWGPPPPPGAEGSAASRAPDLLSAWAAAGAVVDAGKAAALGLADAGLADVEAVLAAAKAGGGGDHGDDHGQPPAPSRRRGLHRPAALQVEAHPALPQRKLSGVCRRLGVALLAAAPLAGGASSLLDHPAVEGVAADAGRTPAQVLLRWSIDRGVPVLVRTADAGHAAEAAGAASGSWTLPLAAREVLDRLETRARSWRPEAAWPDPEVGGVAKPSLVLPA